MDVKKKLTYIFRLCLPLLLLLNACDDMEDKPFTSSDITGDPTETDTAELYALCEGLFNQNNSSLMRFSFNNQRMVRNYFKTINHRGLGDIDAQLAAHRRQLLGVHIVAEGCQQPHIQPHQAHVVGDVPAYAAGAHPHPAGVGILCHQFLTGPAADVHVHTAHHRDVGAAGHDVALSGDAALFHQVGNMHRHAGPCDARPLRQLLLGDHGIRFDPVEYLPFPLGHAAPP